MNREIKFRAWETKEARGRMFSWDEIKDGFISYTNCKETILMQFTGLLDKNGKEIYEGDFINIGNETYGFMQGKDGKLAAYEVKHEGCDYVLKRHDVGTLNWGRLSRLEELLWQCQVVGNVFETPELLNP